MGINLKELEQLMDIERNLSHDLAQQIVNAFGADNVKFSRCYSTVLRLAVERHLACAINKACLFGEFTRQLAQSVFANEEGDIVLE